MTRLRRIALTVVVGVLVTLPTAGNAFAQGTDGIVYQGAPYEGLTCDYLVIPRRAQGARSARPFLVDPAFQGGTREMPRLRRIALTVVVGLLVTLPTAGNALAGGQGSS